MIWRTTTTAAAVDHSKRHKLPYLDGIRAIAALSVFASHAHILQFGALPTRSWTDIVLYSHLAVDVFIVLSGFCLGFAARGKRDTYAKFIKRRCLRVLPAYYGAMLVSGLLWLASSRLLGNGESIPLWALAANAFILNDVLPKAGDYFSNTFWSIGIEFRLYFLFPLFLVLYRRYGAWFTLAASAIVATIWFSFAFYAQQVFGSSMGYLCPWYAVLFVLGLVSSQLLGQALGARYWAMGSFSALLPILWVNRITIAHGWANYLNALPAIDLVAGLGTAALLLFLGNQAIAGRHNIALKVLDWQPLTALAAWSYSLYLLHYPLLKAANLFAGIVGLEGWGAISLETIPVLACCYLFSLVFERPFLKPKPAA